MFLGSLFGEFPVSNVLPSDVLNRSTSPELLERAVEDRRCDVHFKGLRIFHCTLSVTLGVTSFRTCRAGRVSLFGVGSLHAR